ncbi:MAG: tyrosine-type recombinase/integrase [Alphaproteobacteria bacterium]
MTLTTEGTGCFEQWTAGRAASEIVFLRNDGGVWRKSHQSHPLEEASARAGIVPHVTFHILRHTYGSHLAMKGVPMGVIAAQLGHAGTRMTEKHYAQSRAQLRVADDQGEFSSARISGPTQIRRFDHDIAGRPAASRRARAAAQGEVRKGFPGEGKRGAHGPNAAHAIAESPQTW